MKLSSAGAVLVIAGCSVFGGASDAEAQPAAADAAEEARSPQAAVPGEANMTVSSIGGALVARAVELGVEKSAEERVWEGREWSAEAESRSSFPDCLAQWHGDLSGRWVLGGGLDGSWLEMEEGAEGSWQVRFGSWGCLMEWTMERSGTAGRGVLQLDGPVATYLPGEPFSLLFMAVLDGRRVLVPSGYAGILDRLAASEGCEALLFSAVGGGVFERQVVRSGSGR